jgi:hypothetical protein
MTADPIIQRVRSANPASATPIENAALLEAIVATPPDALDTGCTREDAAPPLAPAVDPCRRRRPVHRRRDRMGDGSAKSGGTLPVSLAVASR